MASYNDMVKALAVTTELTNTDLSQGAREIMASELEQFDSDAVIYALNRCRRELKGRMSLSDILERMPGQWPGVEEAWGRIPKSENESGMVFEEMGRAWSVAQPLYDDGDHVAARMAFKDAYEREVSAAKCEGRLPNWFFSPGWDAQEREAAITRARTEGLIGQDKAQALLEQHGSRGDPDPSIKQIVDQSVSGDAQSAQESIEEMRRLVGDRKAS